MDAIRQFKQRISESARVRAGRQEGAVLTDRAAGEADGFRRLRQRKLGRGEGFFAAGRIAGCGDDAIESRRRLLQTGKNLGGRAPALEGIAQFRRGPGGWFLCGIFWIENDGDAARVFFGGYGAGKQVDGGQRGSRGSGGFKKMAARILFHSPSFGNGNWIAHYEKVSLCKSSL
jgi:hypothetical protein